MRKLLDNIKASFTFRPAAVTSTGNGTSIDTQGYFDGMAVLEVGAVTGTTPTLDVKIQESDDNSTWADTGITFTQVTAANSSQVKRISELNVTRKRYLRGVATLAGTSPNFTFNMELLLGDGYSGAVTND